MTLTKPPEASQIREKHEADKTATVNAYRKFLDTHKDTPTLPDNNAIQAYRNDVGDLVSKGQWSDAIKTLEKVREAKTGITLHEVEQGGVKVLVRDARNAEESPVRETEAFEMQYLNAIRTGIDVATIEGKSDLAARLKQEAVDYIKNKNHDEQDQKALAKQHKTDIQKLGILMEEHGVEKPFKKLDVAKDFQNFNDEHRNIVTISKAPIEFTDPETKKTEKRGDHVVAEIEVAMKDKTENQKLQYQNIKLYGNAQDGSANNLPSWYNTLSETEQKLCNKYIGQITDGEHVMPTQLRQLAGMKNAFEKLTFVDDEQVHSSYHAGTLASLSSDKSARQNIANDNARQAKEWIGENLHCNTLNSGPTIGTGVDKTIVKQTQQAMREVGGRETNTALMHLDMSAVLTIIAVLKRNYKALWTQCRQRMVTIERQAMKLKIY